MTDIHDITTTFLLWVLTSVAVGYIYGQISFGFGCLGVGLVWSMWLILVSVYLIENHNAKKTSVQTIKHLFSRGISR